jgi:ABC-type multidrug transport system fused ATPase/permease subunit
VLDGYIAAMRGRTTIVITHRAALATAADRVFELRDRVGDLAVLS